MAGLAHNRLPIVLKIAQIALVASTERQLNDNGPQLVNLSKGAFVVRSKELLEPGTQVVGDMALRFVAVSAGGQAVIADFIEKRARDT